MFKYTELVPVHSGCDSLYGCVNYYSVALINLMPHIKAILSPNYCDAKFVGFMSLLLKFKFPSTDIVKQKHNIVLKLQNWITFPKQLKKIDPKGGKNSSLYLLTLVLHKRQTIRANSFPLMLCHFTP